jgi:hypothetical protein
MAQRMMRSAFVVRLRGTEKNGAAYLLRHPVAGGERDPAAQGRGLDELDGSMRHDTVGARRRGVRPSVNCGGGFPDRARQTTLAAESADDLGGLIEVREAHGLALSCRNETPDAAPIRECQRKRRMKLRAAQQVIEQKIAA